MLLENKKLNLNISYFRVSFMYFLFPYVMFLKKVSTRNSFINKLAGYMVPYGILQQNLHRAVEAHVTIK